MVLVGEILDQAWRNLAGIVQLEATARPKLYAVIVIGVLGFVGGRIVGQVVRTLLKMTALDDFGVRSDMQSYLRKMNYRGSLSDFIADAVTAIIYLLAVFAVFYLFGFRFVADYSQTLVRWASVAFFAIIVMVVGAWIADYLEHVTVRLFRGGRMSGRVDESEAEIPVYVIAGKAVKYLGLTVAFFVALGVLGVGSFTLTVLVAITAIGLIGAVAFGTRDLVRNISISIYFQLSRVFRSGERVSVDGYEGEIVGIRPLYTKIRSDGRTFYVPNTRLVSETIERKE